MDLVLGSKIGILFSGIFLLIGMITGAWKYWEIRHSSEFKAHDYVDIAHRAALMYAPACLILAVMATFSIWSEQLSCILVVGNIFFFVSAVISYTFHGILKDTNNQFKLPHKIGNINLPPILMTLFMFSLVIVEIGCTFVLVIGTMKYLF
ncbi:MAG: hypothetical protein H6553_12850 [Chitinophagales bacterium]|nr:hypothetical protein [Chitinophagales bacterium]